jgi:signal transduction histidine kinase
MAMMALPIRIRLTLWYFIMFASAAALLSLTSFWMLKRSVDAAQYHELQERTDDIQEILSHEDPQSSVAQLGKDLAAIYTLKDDGKYLQVRDEQGNWIFRSQRMIAQNPYLSAPKLLPKTGTIAEFQQGAHTVQTLAYPIVVRGRQYTVQTGIALNKSMVLLDSFRTKLLMLTPIVILLAAVGGHFMSRKALRPVAELAAEARRINDRNLGIRLTVPAARDEISHLSLTLNHMLERIDRAFASVRTFTGNASHELRTPISLMRTEIEVALLRDRDSCEYRGILGRLHGETVRMTELVENLLSLARADGGAETITLASIQVSHLFRQTEKAWKSVMNGAMLDLQVEIPDDTLFVLGDAQAIDRLLSILLENASKYTPPGGSVIMQSIAVEDGIILSVRDSGIGIEPTHLERIFERFYRVPTSGLTPVGSGLGLSLAKWIVQRHGSELSVESVAGSGSCFSFRLNRATSSLPYLPPFRSALAERDVELKSS